VLQPGNLLTLCLLTLVALQFLSRGRGEKVLVGPSSPGFALLAVAPIRPAMMLPSEERFPGPTKLPERIDGILVLGGAVTPPFSWFYGVTAFNCSTVRLLGALALARSIQRTKLVLVGRGLFPVRCPVARAIVGLVVKEGIGPARILLEEKSRTTCETAVYTNEL
jgi:uncharacterized SAM-binding protein YcdF (DUF218 family)